jgi:hypothetical protein
MENHFLLYIFFVIVLKQKHLMESKQQKYLIKIRKQ